MMSSRVMSQVRLDKLCAVGPSRQNLYAAVSSSSYLCRILGAGSGRLRTSMRAGDGR